MSNSRYSSSEMYDQPPLWNPCLFGGEGGTQVCVHPGTQRPFSAYIYHVGSLGIKHLYQLTHLVGPYYDISEHNFL